MCYNVFIAENQSQQAAKPVPPKQPPKQKVRIL